MIESGYRNPAKKKRLHDKGSSENSKHMWGDAVDLRVPEDDLPPSMNKESAKKFLHEVVVESLYDGDDDYYVYLRGNVVHIEYDPKKKK